MSTFAQTATSIRVPNMPSTGSDNLPIAAAPSRYQQWFAAAELQATARFPVRIRSMGFIAGQVLQPGSTVDIEIRMAHMASGLPSSTFANNLVTDNTLVFPRANVTLVANPAPGARIATFNFSTEFWWNGTSSVVVDLKVFGNGNGNQSYLYSCQSVIGAFGRTMRLFAPGTPSSQTTATVSQNGQGLLTEFDYVDGITVSYGTGCLGGGNQVPVAGTVGGLPIPPNPNWGYSISNAAALATTLLVVGGNNTNYAGTPLPIDLSVIGANGCFLRAEALVFFPSSTTAAGTGVVPIPIPGVVLRRRQLFAQWFVLDALAPNGVLSASQGLWTIFG